MRLLPLLLLTACPHPVSVQNPAATEDVPVVEVVDVVVPEPVSMIRTAAQDSTLWWSRIEHLSDDIGHRITGSPQLDEAIRWSVEEMQADGFDEVRAEPVNVEVWVRGHETVSVVAPDPRPMRVLALGNSPGTPDGAIEAEVVVVDSFDHLDEIAADVEGKIVLFDVPFTSYGETVGYRSRGPRKAAELGAVAALVRSVAPTSLSTPHTGGTWFGEGPLIPAVAVTLEDAAWMRRVTEDGETVRVSVDLGAHVGEPTTSANVVGERQGTDLADEIVVLGCHIDSWDVGQGAQDDAAGCMVVWEAGRLLNALPRSRRTLRVVLFTNEENGLAGGRSYVEAHGDENHFAALESDTGAGATDGFRVAVVQEVVNEDGEVSHPVDEVRQDKLLSALGELQPVLQLMHAGELAPGYAGADIGGIVRGGALGFGVAHDTTGYWPIHHTEADTLDKVDVEAMKHNIEATATLAWWLLNADPDLLD